MAFLHRSETGTGLTVSQLLSPDSLRAKTRIGDLVHPEVEKGQSKGNQRDTETCGYECPPRTGQQGQVIAGPKQIGPPGDGARIAQTDDGDRRGLRLRIRCSQ